MYSWEDNPTISTPFDNHQRNLRKDDAVTELRYIQPLYLKLHNFVETLATAISSQLTHTFLNKFNINSTGKSKNKRTKKELTSA